MAPRHSSVVIDGFRLHWAESGADTQKAPLVLLHGLNDSHLSWIRIAPLLSDRRVLMPDAPGCGLSGRPDASYRLDWQAHMIARWLETLGLREVDIAGHSFGGGVAQMLLLESSLTIRRLGLIASGGLGPSIAFWLRLAALPHVVEYFGQPFMAAGTRLALRAAGGAGIIPEREIAELSAMNAESGTARAFARTVHDVINLRGQTKQFLQRAHEAKNLPPITLFWGEEDVITPLADAVAFARMVEGVGLELFSGCGHYLHHEQPEELARRLRAFLDSPLVRPVRLPLREANAALAPPQRNSQLALRRRGRYRKLATPARASVERL
jgi:pimeloyl-ACP methyl ester carboxylesterase